LTVNRTVLQERLINIVKRFSQRRMLVVGDAIADQFVYGAISRVSREAPVFILRHEHTETVPGGAANCAVNLASLGARVSLVSVAGKDEAGKALIERLNSAGVDCSGVVIADDVRTTTKVRILAGQVHSTRQQVIRLDYDNDVLNTQTLRAQVQERVRDHVGAADAIIVSDYNYGIADTTMISLVREAASRQKIPLLADSRFKLSEFASFTSATPNEDEVEQLLAKRLATTADLETAGTRLRDRLGFRALLVTRGGHGITLLEDGVDPLHIEAVGSSEPVDVTGAGDTVMATYALALASEASFPDAARLANYAGGIVVMKRGTAAVTCEELENSLAGSQE